MLAIIASFLFPISSVNAETPSASVLSDGIRAFICKEIDGKKDVPLFFLNEGGTWTLRGFADLSVSKIENGFKFKSTGDNEGFGFFKKNKTINWDFEYLDQKGFYKTKCISQDRTVKLIIESITPKIIKNAKLFIDNFNNMFDLEFTDLDSVITHLYSLEKSLSVYTSMSFTEIERQAALISEANSLLEKEKGISALAQRKLAILKTQSSQLRNQLNELQGLLDESKEADTRAQIQLKSLGTDLNLALARIASEQRKVARLQKQIAELEAREQNRIVEGANLSLDDKISLPSASNHYEVISLTRSNSGNWWDVKVKNTKKDEKIICTLLDKNKKEVAFSDSWYANNMFTTIPINYSSSNVKYAHCISNN